MLSALLKQAEKSVLSAAAVAPSITLPPPTTKFPSSSRYSTYLGTADRDKCNEILQNPNSTSEERQAAKNALIIAEKTTFIRKNGKPAPHDQIYYSNDKTNKLTFMASKTHSPETDDRPNIPMPGTFKGNPQLKDRFLHQPSKLSKDEGVTDKNYIKHTQISNQVPTKNTR